MRWRGWIVMVLVAAALGSVREAAAGVLGRNRYHVVARQPTARRSFVDRLHPATRNNLRGIGVYHRRGVRPGKNSAWGTAFLVGREEDGTGLVLTNHHIVANSLGIGDVTFDDRGSPRTIAGQRLVLSSWDLDYALVRVRNVPADVPVLSVAAKAPIGRVYSAGFDGLANIAKQKPLARYDRTPVERRWLNALPDGPHLSIQTGGILRLDAASRARFDPTKPGPPLMWAALSGITGGSGRPIIERSTHRVIGIHAQGGPGSVRRARMKLSTAEGALAAGASQIVPIRAIVADLERAIAEDRIASDDVPMVRALIAAARTGR